MGEEVKPLEDEKVEGKLIPLRWGSSDGIPTVYANQLYVTHGGPEFYLVFGELPPPITIGWDESQLPECLEIEPRIRIAVTPKAMVAFAEVLSQNVEKYKEKVRKERDKW